MSELTPPEAPTPRTANLVARRPVLKVVLPKKKKRRYSTGLELMQRRQRGVVQAFARAAEAVAVGAATYRDRSEASAFKKRDGAVRDRLKNWSKAVNKAMKVARKVPRDLVKPIDTPETQRIILAAVRRRRAKVALSLIARLVARRLAAR